MEAMDARTLESMAHTLDARDEDAPDDPGPRELLPRETPLQRYDAASNKQAFLDTLQREDPDGFYDLDRYLFTRGFVEEPGPPVAAAVAQLAQLTQMFQEMAEVGYGEWRELQLGRIQDEAVADSIDMASQTGEGALMSRHAEVEPETPREQRPLPAPDTPEGRELSAQNRKLHQLVAAVYTGGALAGMDTEQTKEALLFTWDQLTKWLAGRDINVEDAYYGSMSPQHLDAALGIASSPSQSGQGIEHMRQMLGSGARREQRLQQIAQAVEMRGSGAPNTRPAPQILRISVARLVRKPVTGNPHVGASAPTVIAGSGLTAPAPGYHYMATGELMKDPE